MSSALRLEASTTACSTPRARLGAHEKVQHLPDGPFPADRVPQGEVALDVVPVAAPVLLLDQIARFGEVCHDAVGGALGDAEGDGEVPQPCLGVVGDEHQRPPVAREKAPVTHTVSVAFILEIDY